MAERWLYAWGLGSVAFGGASLLVPLYVVQLGGSPLDLGVLYATATAIGAPGAILFGRLADRVGHRRPLVLLTLATTAAALAVIPLLERVPVVFVANAALWLVVAAVGPVLTMLVVTDAASEIWGERIGQLNTYQGYGWAGGLVLGAVWPVIGRPFLGPELATRGLFFVLAACAVVAVLLAARWLPAPAPGPAVTTERAARRVARLIAASGRGGIRGATFVFAPNRLYWSSRDFHPRRLADRLDPSMTTYLAAAVLFFTGFATFWAPLPLFLTGAGFNAAQIFGLYLVSTLASAALYDRVGTLAGRTDVRLLQTGALATRGVLFPLVALGTGFGLLAMELGIVALVLVLIGGTWAVIAVVGTAIVTRLAPPAVRGELLGVHTALAAVGGGVGGLLGGWVASFGYLVAFGVAGALVVLGAALVVSIRVLSDGASGADASTSPPVGEAVMADDPEPAAVE